MNAMRTILTAVVLCSLVIPGTAACLQERETPDDSLDAAKCDLTSTTRILENALSPQLSPQVVNCIKVDGSCIVSEEVGTEISVTAWHFLIYTSAKINTDVDVTTNIDCSGSFDLTSLNFGGPGLRFAETRMLADAAASFGDSIIGLPDLGEVSNGSVCNYLGPTLACKNTLTGMWASHKEIQGELVAFNGNIQVCAGVRTLNQDGATYLASLPLLGTDLQDNLACDGIPAPVV